MTLSEKITAVREKGDKYVQSTSINKMVGEIDQMKPNIDNAYSDLETAVNVKDTLSEKTETRSPDLSLVIQSLNDIKEALSNNKFDYSEARVLVREALRVKKGIDSDWREYADKQISNAKSIADSVENIISDNEEYQAMLAAEEKINRIEPGNKSVFDYIGQYMEHYEKLMSSLNLSPKVFGFLRKLNTDNAISLSDLDADGFNQLKSSHFANKLKIVIK